MNLILIAPPAAGKGTFASRLTKEFGLVSISAGELLRNIDPETELGKQVRALQAKRELVPDELINGLIKERLSKDDIKNGFILDGYPRYMAQVDAVNETIKELGLTIDYAVLLNVDYETALKRTLGRVICPNCKRTYNKLTGVCKPINDNLCDDCNIELTTRGDDNEESFKKGFETYQKITLPVAEYYKEKGMLIELNSNNDADYTFNEFKSKVEK